MTNRRVRKTRLSLAVVLAGASAAQNLPQSDLPVNASSFWRTTVIADNAEVLTLFVTRSIHSGVGVTPATIPVFAVLRDTLGDPDHQTDRIRYVWLLSSSRPSFEQELLSAVPFFHWHLDTRKSQGGKLPKPVLDLSHPSHKMQQTAWETAILRVASGLPELELGAKANPFFGNRSDHDRRSAAQALSVLRRAPSSEEAGNLGSSELDAVIGRVQLSMTATGGLASEAELPRIRQSYDGRRDAARLRNLEMLRLSAERVGLYLEPLALGEQTTALQQVRYGLLWSPIGGASAIPGTSLAKTWQILQISNPAKHPNLKEAAGYRETFSVDRNGALLPGGEKSESTVELIPVALYSLTYPRMPLLLIDFLHPSRPRHRELNQRLFREMVRTGSYFSPVPIWTLSGAFGAYHFLKSHQGFATDEKARLDSYTEAQMDLALDRSLDADFRSYLQGRLEAMNINPLDSSVEKELSSASASYALLMEALARSRGQLENDRRRELAAFGADRKTLFSDALAHYFSFGLYTRRAPVSPDTLESTKRIRRVEELMGYLTLVTRERVRPEVSFNVTRIESAIEELSILTQTSPPAIRENFMRRTRDLAQLSQDAGIRRQCLDALGGYTVAKASNTAIVPGNVRPGL